MHMPDFLVLIATFVTGAAAGFFIYSAGFKEIDIDPSRPISADDFEITVAAYGGCAMGGVCPSYRLLSDGRYTLLPGDLSDNLDPVTGSLSEKELARVGEALSVADLAGMSTEKVWDYCESWADGIDTTYTIRRGTLTYQLDTCSTAIDVDDELIELLDEYFVRAQ